MRDELTDEEDCMRYLMRQRVFSLRDAFTIQHEDGRDAFTVDGKFWSIGHQLT